MDIADAEELYYIVLKVMRAVRVFFFQNPCDWAISLGELKSIGV